MLIFSRLAVGVTSSSSAGRFDGLREYGGLRGLAKPKTANSGPSPMLEDTGETAAVLSSLLDMLLDRHRVDRTGDSDPLLAKRLSLLFLTDHATRKKAW